METLQKSVFNGSLFYFRHVQFFLVYYSYLEHKITASVGLGLWDVGENVRVYFEPDAEVHLFYNLKDLTSAQPKIAFFLSVFGDEVDGCGIMHSNPNHSVTGFFDCALNENDKIGDVKGIHEYSWPTTFGKQENTFTGQSSTGDYNIKYQISLETESQSCNAALASDPNIHHDECVPLFP
jgi:hypothetical protein